MHLWYSNDITFGVLKMFFLYFIFVAYGFLQLPNIMCIINMTENVIHSTIIQSYWIQNHLDKFRNYLHIRLRFPFIDSLERGL